MYSEDGINRGVKIAQFNQTVEKHQGPSSPLKGIIKKVNVHTQTAIVAVLGGDATSTVYKNLIAIYTKNGQEKIERIKGNIGSNTVEFEVKIPPSSSGSTVAPIPGTHVDIYFTKGIFKPVIKNYTNIPDVGVNEDKSVIYIDDSSGEPSFQIIRGSGDIDWTSSPGVPGYKFSPFSQNPHGGQVSVALNDKYKLLLKDPQKINPKLIKKVKSTSTPAGHASWVDPETEAGHHAIFADKVHILTKDVSKVSLGSNKPNISTLESVKKSLAEESKISLEPSAAKASFDKKDTFDKYAISPIVSALAKKEIEVWRTNSNLGFISASNESLMKIPLEVSPTSGQVSQNENFTSKIKSDTSWDYGINLKLSQSFSMAFKDFQNVFSNSTKNSIQYLCQIPESDIAPGSGHALISLIAAIRLSLISNSYNHFIEEYLLKNLIKVTASSNLLNDSKSFNCYNFFGAPYSGISYNNFFSSLITLQSYPSYVSDSFINRVDSLSYGDLISRNLHYLRSDSNQISVNLNVSNLCYVGHSSDSFSDLIPFSAETNTITEEQNLPLICKKSWVFNLWTAQAMAVAQEIAAYAYEFKQLLKNSRLAGDLEILKPVKKLAIIDDSGIKKEVYISAWDTSFVVYAVLKLYNGDLGKKIADSFVSLVHSSVDATTEVKIENLIRSYIPETIFPSPSNIWETSLLERVKFVLNTLAKYGHIVRN
jgi:hypothetical protein